uniref:Semaphorin 3F n=1 Tax=Eptatretus burgeri TaxID=7764 RepID=A0A8C4NF98_EPTBU
MRCGAVLCFLLVLPLALEASVEAQQSVSKPRAHLSYKKLSLRRWSKRFSLPGVVDGDYRILLLDEDLDRVFLGAKDYVISLNVNNISRLPLTAYWPAGEDSKEECSLAGKNYEGECGNFVRVIQPYNRTHLYVCGSGAYHPVCTYALIGARAKDHVLQLTSETWESGKGKCSYSPKLDSISLMLRKELYSGVYLDFMGTDATLSRTLGHRHPLRTDQYNSRWLNEPIFLNIHMIPDSGDHNDDKLYFFSREKSAESGSQKSVFARIGRVCLNDIGGQRNLVNKWSTFLKARLVCSVMGSDGIETHFDELQDIYVRKTEDLRNPIIYGVFSTSGSVFKGSAVCVYNMADIRMVFNGPFAHKEGPSYQWVPYQGKIPYPRPGTCPGGTFTPTMRSTKDFPDDVVSFIQSHPTMYYPVYPVQRHPLVVRTNIQYKYTHIAVDHVSAADGRYEVLFLATDVGTVQKIMVLQKEGLNTEDVLLEELQVFKPSTPILSMKISSKRQQIYVSSSAGVAQVSLHRCNIYGTACADCCLARDPYCAWDGKQCSKYFPTTKRRTRRQDIRHGNPNTQCQEDNHKMQRKFPAMVQYAVEGSSTFMVCTSRSPLALIKWFTHKTGEEGRNPVKRNKRVVQTDQGLLIRKVRQNDAGHYHCLAKENDFRHMLGRFHLKVLQASAVGGVLAGDGDSSTSLTPRSGYRPHPACPSYIQGRLRGTAATMAKLRLLSAKERQRNRRAHHHIVPRQT